MKLRLEVVRYKFEREEAPVAIATLVEDTSASNRHRWSWLHGLSVDEWHRVLRRVLLQISGREQQVLVGVRVRYRLYERARRDVRFVELQFGSASKKN